MLVIFRILLFRVIGDIAWGRARLVIPIFFINLFLMDFQFWLYVIVGVIYLVSRLMKKPEGQGESPDYESEKPVRPSGGAQGNPDRNVPRELTFEELLREITEGKTIQRQAPQPAPVVTTPSPYASYETVTEDEEDDFDEYRSNDRTVKVYEEGKRQAFERKSLEETMSLDDTEMTYVRFKEFEEKKRNPVLEQYLGDLNDPDSWKKAVIMSEILQRKF